MDHHQAAIPYQPPWQLELADLCNSPSFQFDNSATGLSYLGPEPLSAGDMVQFKLPSLTDQVSAKLRVTHCQPQSQQGYLIQLQFINEEQAYRFRMMEQLCQIQQYQQQMQQQGRQLNLNEAAAEWINDFAASFKSITATL